MRVDVHDPAIRGGSVLYRCLLDGVDISNDCFASDDIEGWADCYVRERNGSAVIRDGELVTVRRRGHVELIRKDVSGG